MSAYRTAGRAGWRHVAWLLVIVLCMVVLTGCTTLPEPDCQVRAGAAIPEGSAVGGPFSGSYAAVGAAASMVGDCPENFRVFSRYNGSLVCYGDEAWCQQALTNQPVEVTPTQLREMIAP